MGPISPIQYICERVDKRTRLMMSLITINWGYESVRGG